MKLNYSYLSINDNYYSGYAQIPKIIEHIDKNNQNCEMTTENIGGVEMQVCKTETNNDKDNESDQSSQNVIVSLDSESINIPKYTGLNTYVSIEVKTPSYNKILINIPNVNDLEHEIVDKVIPIKDKSKNNSYSFYEVRKDINCDSSEFIGPSLTTKKNCVAKGYVGEDISIDEVFGWQFSGEGDTAKYNSYETAFDEDKIKVYGVIDEENKDLLIELNTSKPGSITKTEEEVSPQINYRSLFESHVPWNSYFTSIGHYNNYFFDDNSLNQKNILEEEDKILEEENLLEEEDRILEEENLLEEEELFKKLLEEEDKILQEENLLEEEQLFKNLSNKKVLNLNTINNAICSSDIFPNHNVNPDPKDWKTWIKNRKLINPFNLCSVTNGKKPEYKKVNGINANLESYQIIQPIKNEKLVDPNIENQVKFTFIFSDKLFTETKITNENTLVDKPSYSYDFTKEPNNNYIIEDNYNDIAECINTSFSNNQILDKVNSYIKLRPYTNASNGFSIEFYIYWNHDQDFQDVNIFDLAFSPSNNNESANLIHDAKNVKDIPDGYCNDGVVFGKYCCAKSCGICGGSMCSSRSGGKYNCCPENIKRTCTNDDPTSCIIPGLNSYTRFGNKNSLSFFWYSLGGDSPNIQYSYESNKWTHVVMSISQNNILDVYFNGNKYEDLNGKNIERIKSGFRNYSVIGRSSADTLNNTSTKMKIKYFRIWNNHNLNDSEVKKLYDNREDKASNLDIFKTIKETFVDAPTYNFEFRKNKDIKSIIYDNISRLGLSFNGNCRSTENDGIILDGIDSYLKFDENVKIIADTGLTIEFFARIENCPNTNSDKRQTIFLFSESMETNANFMLTQSEKKLNLTNENSNSIEKTDISYENLDIGFWTHYVYTISLSDSRVDVYVDGELIDNFNFENEINNISRLNSYIGGHYPDKYQEQWYEKAVNFYSLDQLKDVLNENNVGSEEDSQNINISNISKIFFYNDIENVKYCRVFVIINNLTYNSFVNFENDKWLWERNGNEQQINSDYKEIYPSSDLINPIPKRFAKMKMKYFRVWNSKSLDRYEIENLYKFRNYMNIFSYENSSVPVNIPIETQIDSSKPYYNFDFRLNTPANGYILDNIMNLKATYKGGLISNPNNGIILDGSNSYIEFDTSFKTIGYAGFSIEFYAYFFQIDYDSSIWWLSRESNWSNGRELGMSQTKENDKDYFLFRNEGKDIKIEISNLKKSPFYQFSHYVITISNLGTLKFYQNGELVSEVMGTFHEVRDRIRENSFIGAYYPNSNESDKLGYSRMLMKYFRVWNTELTLDKIFILNKFKNRTDIYLNLTEELNKSKEVIKEEAEPKKILLLSELKTYAPHFNFDFRVDESTKITDTISDSAIVSYKNNAISTSNGLTLDGVNNFAEISNFELGYTFSIEIYLKIDTNSKSTIFEFSNGDLYTNKDQIILESRNNAFRFYSRTGNKITKGYSINDIGNFNNTDYIHFITVIDGTQNIASFYQNGKLVSESRNIIKQNPLVRNSHLIGKNLKNSDYLKGDIRYFRIWRNFKLTSNDVEQLYEYKDMTLVFKDNKINPLPINFNKFDYKYFIDENGCLPKSESPTFFCEINNQCQTSSQCQNLRIEAEEEIERRIKIAEQAEIDRIERDRKLKEIRRRREEARMRNERIAEEERQQRELDRKKAEEEAKIQSEKDKAEREAKEKEVRDKEKADREAAFKSSAEKAAERKRLEDLAAARKVEEDKKVSDRAAAESKAKAEKGTSYRNIASSGSTRESKNNDKAGSLIGKLTGSSNAPDIARANEKANQGGGISIYLILILLIVITCLILKKYYS